MNSYCQESIPAMASDLTRFGLRTTVGLPYLFPVSFTYNKTDKTNSIYPSMYLDAVQSCATNYNPETIPPTRVMMSYTKTHEL